MVCGSWPRDFIRTVISFCPVPPPHGRAVVPRPPPGRRGRWGEASRPLQEPHMDRPWNGRDVRSPSKPAAHEPPPAAHEPRPAAHEPRTARPSREEPLILSCRSCSCSFRVVGGRSRRSATLPVCRLGGTPRPTETCSLFTVTCSLKERGALAREPFPNRTPPTPYGRKVFRDLYLSEGETRGCGTSSAPLSLLDLEEK